MPTAPKITPGQLDSEITVDEWVESNRWVEVDSSNVKGIAYVGGELFVEFLSGDVYGYRVDENYAKAMFKSSSMGKFVWKMRRENVPYRKVLSPLATADYGEWRSRKARSLLD